MNKTILTTIVILASFVINAQNIPYEKLDSISAIISKSQLKADGLTYNDGNEDYILSFPKKNFQILYSTGKAQRAVYKKKGDTEYLYLTENIDLTKAFDIYQALYPGLAGVFRLTFPEGVKTQVYTNGIYTNTITEYYLEFFYDRNEVAWDKIPFFHSGKKFLISLSSMVAFIKLEHKITCEEFILNSNINIEKYSSQVKNNYNNYKEKLYKDVQYYSDLTRNAGYNNYMSHREAAYYYEKAILIKTPKVYWWRFGLGWTFDSFLDHLYYGGNYERLGEVINSPDIYFQNITQYDLIHNKSRYLIGTGKCLEAEKLLLDTFNSPNSSQELKSRLKWSINLLYDSGCKGSKGNKVKKDKILAAQYE